jgi:hypothetical protein|uniref:Uncharacterized protein n=1 Tax=Firmicutes phage HS18 TaxID=3056396 RepID=A0AA50AFT6_9VIRU|nr:MAG: hypothetical protein [Firmicutes phage HS18]
MDMLSIILLVTSIVNLATAIVELTKNINKRGK